MAAEDEVLRARIVGDASGLKAAMEAAAASTEANIARIKASYKEAQAEVKSYENSLKGLRETAAVFEKAAVTPENIANIERFKAAIADAEAGLEAARAKAQALTGELAKLKSGGATGGGTVVAPPVGAAAGGPTTDLTEKQINFIISAIEAEERQLLALEAIQAEVAANVNGSVSEMAAVYQRAVAEMTAATGFLNKAEIGLGAAAREGSAEAIAALETVTAMHTRAAAVLTETKAAYDALKASQAEAAAAAAAEADAQVEAAAELGLTAEQIDLVNAAFESLARQQSVLPAIQEEAAARVDASVTEMEAIYKRATTEMALAAKVLADAQKGLGEAEVAGFTEASIAIETASAAFTRAAAVENEVKARLAATTKEAAAAAELYARAESSSTPATLAAARAEADAAIARHGSAVAALEAAEAEEKEAAAREKATAAAQKAAEKSAAAANEEALAFEKVAESSSGARLGLSELIGSQQGMLFAMSRIVAASPALSAAVGAAFPLIGAIAFIDIFSDVISKIFEGIDALAGWDAAAKKAHEDFITGSREAITNQIKLNDELRKIGEIGLSGVTKFNAEIKDHKSNVDDLRKAWQDAEKDVVALNKALDQTNLAQQKLRGGAEIGREFGEMARRVTGGAIPGVPEHLGPIYNTADLEKQLEDAKKFAEQSAKAFQDALVEGQKLPKEKQAEGFKESIETQKNALETQRDLAKAHAEDLKKFAQEQYADKKIAADQETALLTDAENQRYNAEYEYVQKYNALQRQLQARGEVAPLKNEELVILESARNIHDIEIGQARETQRQLREINEEKLRDAQEHAAAAAAAAPEGTAKRAELADLQAQLKALPALPPTVTPLAPGAVFGPEAIRELEANGYKYTSVYQDILKRLPALTREAGREAEEETRKSVNDQFELWVEAGHRTQAQIIDFWRNVITAAEAGATATNNNAALIAEADRKLAAAEKSYREELIKTNEERLKQQETTAIGALEIQKTQVQRQYITAPPIAVNPVGLTAAQQEQQAIAAIDLQELDEKRKTINEQIALQQQAGVQDPNAYQKLIGEKIKLDEEYDVKSRQLDNQRIADEIANFRKYYDEITNDIFKGVNEWILSQKKFGQAMIQVWKDIVGSVVKDLEQIAAKLLFEQVLLKLLKDLLGQTTGAKGPAQTAAGAATQAGTQAAAGAAAGPLSHIPIIGGALSKIATGISGQGSPQQQLIQAMNQLKDEINQEIAAIKQLIVTMGGTAGVAGGKGGAGGILSSVAGSELNTLGIGGGALGGVLGSVGIGGAGAGGATNMIDALNNAYQAITQNTQAIQQLTQQMQQQQFSGGGGGGGINSILGGGGGGAELGGGLSDSSFIGDLTSLFSFAQGGIMPTDSLAQIHKNEMILPAHISSHVMATAGNAYRDKVTPSPSVFSSSGDTITHNHVHVTSAPKINVTNNADLGSLLSAHADDIGRIALKQMKTFNR